MTRRQIVLTETDIKNQVKDVLAIRGVYNRYSAH